MNRTLWLVLLALGGAGAVLALAPRHPARPEEDAALRSGGASGPTLARGWFRIPSGTVYSSEGNGHVCGYASWEQFMRAGGSSGAWTQLEALPPGLINDGVCPDARGALPKGWVRIPSGTVYSSDGSGHVCGYASWEHFVRAGGSSGAWTQLEALPPGTIDDGPCPAAPARPRPSVEYGYLPKGWFRIPSGTVYSSDGRGHVCGYASWEQYVLAGGTAGAWTQLQELPGGLRDDGVCP